MSRHTWMRAPDGFVHAFPVVAILKIDGMVTALGRCAYSGPVNRLINFPVGRYCLDCSDAVAADEDEDTLAAQKPDRGTPE